MSQMVHLDARNCLCPMPVIKTQNQVKTLQPGDQLVVTCTDPGAKHDIPTWCRINRHKVLDIAQNERELTITIEIGDRSPKNA